LIVYVVYSDPGDTMITRNYVTYLTSNAILLGAEFDKIISILVVTAIIAVAIHRARGLLVRAVAEQTAARELSRFFDSGVARRIARSEESITAGSGEARNAAIVNLDMRGFTALAEERSPDEVMAVLADYQSRMVPVLQEHGGSIDKFMGDGIMATFGAAQQSETYAADALRAIEAAMKAAEAWELEAQQAGRSVPRINAAAAHGRVVFGAVGDENRLEYTVIGDAVNLSAKLEKHNKVEKARALVTAELYELALQQGYQAPGAPDRRAARKVAGVAQPLDLVVVTA
jgi:adenylate cyclase